MAKWVGFFFVLYPVALMTSIAGMEAIGWTLFLLFLFQLGLDFKAQGFSATIDRLKFGWDWTVWGFFFSVVLGAFVVVGDWEDIKEAVGEARWVFLLYSHSYLLKTYFTSSWRRFLPVVTGVVSLAGIVSLLQFFFGLEMTRGRNILAPVGDFYRASGFFNLPLTFAYSVGMASFVLLGILVSEYLTSRDKKTLSHSAGPFLGFAGVITSLTRGAWLAAAAAVLALLYRLKKSWAVVGVLVLVVVSGALYMGNSTIRGRFDSLTTITGNESNRLRTVLWRAHWEIFTDNKLLGVGLNENPKYLLDYYAKLGMKEEFVSHAHNNVLQMLAGTGVLGTFFFLAFCLYFFVLSFRLYYEVPRTQVFLRGLVLGVFAAQIHFHLGGMTECNFIDGEVNHQLVFLWALLLAIQYQIRQKPPLSSTP